MKNLLDFLSEAAVSLNPNYIFVTDRDSAINTASVRMASEIIENELIMKTDVYQSGNFLRKSQRHFYQKK